jgi:hypothetical protein
MPHGVPESDWISAKAQAIEFLRHKAVQANPLTTYSELVSKIDAVSLQPDDHRLHGLLEEISREDHSLGHGMLSVLVVHKQGEQRPGAGFFKLARELGYDTSDEEKFFIAELDRVKSANNSRGTNRHGFNFNGRTVEVLPFDVPDYPGASHPISRGNPKFYRPESLKDHFEGKTNRTSVFERTLVSFYLRLGRPVPYAFIAANGEIRSLDAGCIKFLLNRPNPEIELIVDDRGEISAVRPLPALVKRYRPIHAKLLNETGLAGHIELPFDVNDPVDERRKQVSNQIIREGATVFRAAVLAAWSNCCAVTGTSVGRTLQAAHIFRYLGPQSNSPYNGIALRADIHALFDAYLISMRYEEAGLVIRVSDKIKGTEYCAFSNKQVTLPTEVANRPHEILIDRHFRTFTERRQARK